MTPVEAALSSACSWFAITESEGEFYPLEVRAITAIGAEVGPMNRPFYIVTFALVAAVIALAACGSRDMTPSEIAVPGSALTGDAVAPDAGSCILKGQTWRFHGACKNQKLSAKGGVVQLAYYKGVLVQSALSWAFRKVVLR
jgi:hypothetical protein